MLLLAIAINIDPSVLLGEAVHFFYLQGKVFRKVYL